MIDPEIRDSDPSLEYWGLRFDPFASARASYVSTSTHAEAAARLIHAIRSSEPRIQLRAGAGLGKTMVLGHALAEARTPRMRIGRASFSEGHGWLLDISTSLGGPSLSNSTDRASAWRMLAERARLARLQGLGLILAVDQAHVATGAGREDLDRLASIDLHPKSRITVIEIGRDPDELPPPEPWNLAIRLAPLLHSEIPRYLAEKLGQAGRDEPTFTPRAASRIYALSGGIPRAIDRLAGLSLRAGCVRRLEMVPPDVVDAIASECVVPLARSG